MSSYAFTLKSFLRTGGPVTTAITPTRKMLRLHHWRREAFALAPFKSLGWNTRVTWGILYFSFCVWEPVPVPFRDRACFGITRRRTRHPFPTSRASEQMLIY
jgi:hypothetical protein